MPSTAERGAAPGPGVDASGRPVIDPTQNVLDLVQAAIKRQDDLRELEASHVREIMNMRQVFNTELRRAESDRIDAIRAVDVEATARAAAEAAERANVLATQLQTNREDARANLFAALEPIMKDIQEIRKVQYEQQGAKTQGVEGTARTQFSVTTIVAIAIGSALLILGVLNYTSRTANTIPDPVVVTVPVPTPTTLG